MAAIGAEASIECIHAIEIVVNAIIVTAIYDDAIVENAT
jgi:hypothetical protein